MDHIDIFCAARQRKGQDTRTEDICARAKGSLNEILMVVSIPINCPANQAKDWCGHRINE